MREKPVRTAFFDVIYFILDLNQTFFFSSRYNSLLIEKDLSFTGRVQNIENNCYINIRTGNPEAKVQTIVGAFEVN